MEKKVIRYSDAELAGFRELIEKKLEKARLQLEDIRQQIQEISENSDEDFGRDLMDDSSLLTSIEMLSDMAFHQQKYIRNLENALIRIQNKSYGICSVTGELIDKRRLIAVPTTTKSLLAKQSLERFKFSSNRSASGMDYREEEDSLSAEMA